MEITFEDWRQLLRHIYTLIEYGYINQWLVGAILVLLVILLVLVIIVSKKINKISETTNAIKTNQEILKKELLKKL